MLALTVLFLQLLLESSQPDHQGLAAWHVTSLGELLSTSLVTLVLRPRAEVGSCVISTRSAAGLRLIHQPTRREGMEGPRVRRCETASA